MIKVEEGYANQQVEWSKFDVHAELAVRIFAHPRYSVYRSCYGLDIFYDKHPEIEELKFLDKAAKIRERDVEVFAEEACVDCLRFTQALETRIGGEFTLRTMFAKK
jgi:hypothetical protein